MSPALADRPLPTYPLLARAAGEEGRVLLDVAVDADGRASAVRVAASSGFASLDEAARRTVAERWRFVPATRDSRDVPGTVLVPVLFHL